ncbi:ornithine carbamoyltransferase [Alteribacter lacisalsi]|uniref:Ornithine carbamoyltransferase n=1 Tax=Alteribacter lacisalsi TaxID=2045244 RepID=A0A2W0HHI5_9BACI|nr:ornithine carbamoyltransferase [Alteribacter lacisalsi]PYZ96269.1 ornithine carbamoyltransferase [Alteribacter lacisalsi]
MNTQQKSKNASSLKKKQDFLTLADLGEEQLLSLLEEAIDLKSKQKMGIPHEYAKGKSLAMIFEKASTRTRISFEMGMIQLGGHAIFLNSKDIQLGRGESISDTAKVLSGYVDGIMIRTFAHETIEELAEEASVPVINGLTDLHHPAQVLADLMTIFERKGKLEGLKLCFIGDGNNNIAHSLLQGAAMTGMDMTVASPHGFEPDPDLYHQARTAAEQKGSSISFTYSPEEAAVSADVVVTDVWTSMGQENETKKRLAAFKSYQVNEALCELADSDYMFLHCLPAHRGEEVTAGIIDGPHSSVFEEAENRLHAQKALLKMLLA